MYSFILFITVTLWYWCCYSPQFPDGPWKCVKFTFCSRSVATHCRAGILTLAGRDSAPLSASTNCGLVIESFLSLPPTCLVSGSSLCNSLLTVPIGFPGGSMRTESACNGSSAPGWGRSPGGGHGNPLQYTRLGDPMDRGAWWATVHGVAESRVGHDWSTWARSLTVKLLPYRGCTTRVSFGSWITLPFPKRPRVQNVQHPSRHSEQRHVASAAVVLPSTAAPWLQGGSTEEEIVSPCLSRWLKPLSVCSPSTINFSPSRENLFFSFFFK